MYFREQTFHHYLIGRQENHFAFPVPESNDRSNKIQTLGLARDLGELVELAMSPDHVVPPGPDRHLVPGRGVAQRP